MHSLSILVNVFMEAFSAPPVLFYAYQTHFIFTLHGVAMLKDVPREFYVCVVFKHFCQNIGQLCIKMVRIALLLKGYKSLYMIISNIAALYTLWYYPLLVSI